jgi:response regulator RpfG family c-di-GMP phosphodiesterase
MSENGQRLRLLCVDDEPNVLEGIARGLRRDYDVVTATSAAEGLAIIAAQPQFAIVMSDLRMPGRDGISFLAEVHRVAPDTVRVLLTGQADLDGAIAAINEGHIFKFLTKPLPLPLLTKALAGAAEQYRLITSERVLLEQTLHGSLKALTDILALAQPTAFGRATRLKRHVSELAERVAVADRWQVEIAALLSQVGSITLQPDLLEKLYYGKALTRQEAALAARLPRIAEQLIEHIPRLEPVREILKHIDTPFAVSGSTRPAVPQNVPIGARLLAIAIDFDVLDAQGMLPGLAMDTLEGRPGRYDPALLREFRALRGLEVGVDAVREMRLADVAVGMVFAGDVLSANGQLLIARGQEVTHSLRERIENYWASFATATPVRMIMSNPGAVVAARG